MMPNRPVLLSLMVLALAVLPPSGASAESKLEPGQVRMVMTRTIEDVIRPGYDDFRRDTATLAQAVNGLCVTPNGENLDRARAAFKTTALGWGGVEFVRFGPVMAEYRLERVLFWPDRKSTGLKQVQAALATRDKSVTDSASLKEKSVALQGLGALEFILFGTGSQQLAAEAGFRCDYAATIAANLASIGSELSSQWNDPDGIAAYWTADRDANSVGAILNQLVATMVHGLEAVRDTRLRPFVDISGKRDRPKSALFWRSGMAIPVLRVDIEGLSHFFEESAMELLLPADQTSIADSIKFEFRQATDLLRPGDDDRPVKALLADNKARSRLVLLDTILSSLIDRFDKQYAPATGLAAGFSFADGD